MSDELVMDESIYMGHTTETFVLFGF